MSVSHRQKILWWILKAFVLSVPLSSFLSMRILILACIYGLFACRSSQVPLKLSRNAWDLMLFIATLIFGLTYTTNLNDGFRVLETSFCLFALPLVLAFCVPMDKSRINQLFIMFITGLAIGSLIMIGGSFLKFIENLDISKLTYYNLTDTLGFQPTYYAYYLILAICGCLYATYYELTKAPVWLMISATIYFYVTLILSGGETALISLIFILSFFILKYLLDKHTTRKIVVAVLSGVMLFLVLALSYYNNLDLHPDFQTDYWERGILWRSAIDANPNPIFGVGTGDYREVFNDYFVAHNMGDYAKESLNSHNQYIQVYFSNGLFGLMSLLVVLFRPLYFSFHDQNPLGILLLFPFAIYGVTEVFLGRYQGVVIFALVHQLVVLMYQERKMNNFTLSNSDGKLF